jgi:membrane protein
LRGPELPGAAVDFAARSLRRFVEIEGSQQATVLAAQAFTSLIPFLVVAAAFGPGEGDLADNIDDAFNLSGSAERSMRALFNSAGETESAVTWVSIIILILSTTSFSRAMQRMFERCYEVDKAPLREAWRSLIWLAAFGAWIVISGPLRETFREAGIVLAIAASTVTGFALWLGTPMILLQGRIDWRRLAPGALVSGVLAALATVASGIYLPILMTWSADRYGLIGIAFALQSFLVVMGFVIVIGAVVGAVTSELYGAQIERVTRRRARERAA